ncbi:YicC/YloC family endoribonuclease [Calderihabitans maritimus]|uniref:YicC domain-containing protein n=1 Tax=Calderihabitans maritimus TaxID=1246530 RepID=A0A1Z5HWP0_9FIRM|nr:YicC/YloC family endoribonuclease [Calderihabitans maritimus]GAW93949.1 YicC domain-containing protein [Calderihabitans maritimus]
MLRSMTGYGQGQASGEGKNLNVEIRTVNHRFLDLVIRMPRQYLPLEERIKEIIKEKIFRGRVDVYFQVEDKGEKKRKVKVDKELALAYYSSLKELAQILAIPYNISVFEISQYPDVLVVEEPEEDLEELWPVFRQAVEQALEQLVEMRAQEGMKLREDLLERQKVITRMVREIEEREPVMIENYRDKLSLRIKELARDIEIDEDRLAQEVTFFSERSNITEEIVRLYSHLQQLEETLNSSGPVGRKLDFLVQEMNREINTIGSKAEDLIISRKVVQVKTELEKIREQVQNIE